MITVLGTGTMSKGIALEFLKYNFDVNLVATEDHLDLNEINEDTKYNIGKIIFNKEISNELTKLANIEIDDQENDFFPKYKSENK